MRGAAPAPSKGGGGGAMGGGAMGSGAMGGGALGGSAMAMALARQRLTGPPPASAAWIAFSVRLSPGQRLEHRHAFSFVYPRTGGQMLTVGPRMIMLGAGAAAVASGARHVHWASSRSPSVFWEVLLAPSAAATPPRGAAPSPLFRSAPLVRVPPRAEAAFVEVRLPPGGRTSVHTHPGPEFIYVTNGSFKYQNGIIGTRTVSRGSSEQIPPRVPVQKRNPGARPARFLSWFLVDPRRPFASPARFATLPR